MNDPDSQYFLPVVFWINGRIDDYDQELADLQIVVRPFVKAQMNRKGQGRRFEADEVDSVVSFGFVALQQMILDQYLPALHPEQLRSVGRVWSWWDATGIKIRTEKDKVAVIASLPPSDGEAVWQSPEGPCYRFEFYRNETRDNRLRWLLNFLRNTASAAAAKERSACQAMDPKNEPSDTSTPFTEDVANRELVRRLGEITDSADREIVAAYLRDDRPAAPPKDRKNFERARRKLWTACILLSRPTSDAVAQSYLTRLRKASDGNRGVILKEYYDRYLKPRKPNSLS